MPSGQSLTVSILEKEYAGLLDEWLDARKAAGVGNDTRMTDAELKQQGAEFLKVLGAAVSGGNNIAAPGWAPVRQFLENVSRSRALQGFTSEETATFIFSLKKPLFSQIRRATSNNPESLAEATWEATELIDKLGMHTVKAFQKSREEVINRQQEEMLELSTPVVKLWEGIIALPMIGTLDSARTQIVMESLLQRIVETGAEIAIIDITGVPTVDTLVAQHLLKTVTAIRLMGADCIISGIRPQIAQTIVHLGIELQGITTKANLADALAIALKRSGLTVTKAQKT
jgi:rsbT co-antagonist protein RsbR